MEGFIFGILRYFAAIMAAILTGECKMVIYQPLLHSSEDYDNDDGVNAFDDDHDDDHDDVDKEFDDSGIQRAGQTAICCCSKHPRVVTVHQQDA